MFLQVFDVSCFNFDLGGPIESKRHANSRVRALSIWQTRLSRSQEQASLETGKDFAHFDLTLHCFNSK